ARCRCRGGPPFVWWTSSTTRSAPWLSAVETLKERMPIPRLWRSPKRSASRPTRNPGVGTAATVAPPVSNRPRTSASPLLFRHPADRRTSTTLSAKALGRPRQGTRPPRDGCLSAVEPAAPRGAHQNPTSLATWSQRPATRVETGKQSTRWGRHVRKVGTIRRMVGRLTTSHRAPSRWVPLAVAVAVVVAACSSSQLKDEAQQIVQQREHVAAVETMTCLLQAQQVPEKRGTVVANAGRATATAVALGVQQTATIGSVQAGETATMSAAQVAVRETQAPIIAAAMVAAARDAARI